MEGHADSKGCDTLRPRLLHDCSLSIKGRSHRIGCCRKRSLHRIADHLEEYAVVPLRSCPYERQMACDRGCHRLSVPFAQRGAAIDVGEEEGDGAGREIGHYPLQ
jgi:hypothetical protein